MASSSDSLYVVNSCVHCGLVATNRFCSQTCEDAWVRFRIEMLVAGPIEGIIELMQDVCKFVDDYNRRIEVQNRDEVRHARIAKAAGA